MRQSQREWEQPSRQLHQMRLLKPYRQWEQPRSQPRLRKNRKPQQLPLHRSQRVRQQPRLQPRPQPWPTGNKSVAIMCQRDITSLLTSLCATFPWSQSSNSLLQCYQLPWVLQRSPLPQQTFLLCLACRMSGIKSSTSAAT